MPGDEKKKPEEQQDKSAQGTVLCVRLIKV